MRASLREPRCIRLASVIVSWLLVVSRIRVALGLAALVFMSADCATVPLTGRSQLVLISDDEMAALADEPAARLQNYFRQSGRILSASESPDAEAVIALVNKVS